MQFSNFIINIAEILKAKYFLTPAKISDATFLTEKRIIYYTYCYFKKDIIESSVIDRHISW